MDDSFFTERARQVREIATKADPFTKKRLLELANRYERNTTRRVTPLPPLRYRIMPTTNMAAPIPARPTRVRDGLS